MKEKRGKKFLEVLNSKPVIGALIFVMLSLVMVMAGNVDFKEGDLNVSNVLYVDSANSRVGIGTSSPSNTLEVDGNGSFTGNLIAPGHVIQIVNNQTGAVSTGTTVIPGDDTIPQSTEGTEFMTLAITPTNSNNKLKIDVMIVGTHTSGDDLTTALFQDSGTDAIASTVHYQSGGPHMSTLVLSHFMTAGTTNSTTFRVRSGSQTGGTYTFNGEASTRRHGGVLVSSITITEISV